MPKILRIINRFNIGGPTYNATFLTSELKDEFETLLVGGLPEKGEADSLHIPKEYGVTPMLITELKRTPSFKNDRAAYRKLIEIIREFKPDIVHTHASKAGALGRKAAKKCGVPIIVHTFHGHVFHSYFNKLKSHLVQFIERRLSKITTAIVTISNQQKQEICFDYGICPEEKTYVVPLGFDLTKFKRSAEMRLAKQLELGLNNTIPTIAIIGRLVPIKNHSFFIKVIERISALSDSHFTVLIVGDGTERKNIENQIQHLALKPGQSIRLIGWEKDIASFNNCVDIICLSSDNEGTPVSLIEAQAGSIPVISTNVGGVQDILLDGETGFIIEKGNLEDYAEKLLDLINDEKKRLKMSQNGWNFVQQKFSKETLASNMSILYHKLLNNK